MVYQASKQKDCHEKTSNHLNKLKTKRNDKRIPQEIKEPTDSGFLSRSTRPWMFILIICVYINKRYRLNDINSLNVQLCEGTSKNNINLNGI